MQRHKGIWGVLLLGVTISGAGAQTRVDLRTQSKSIDFAESSFTKPFKSGTTLPATCAIGEAFFKTDAAAGQNVYGCTALNSWALQSGAVSSVFGRTGAISARSGDYSFPLITGTVGNSQVGAGIDAAKIGTGVVANAAFGYLANVTSDVQAQLNGKAASVHSHNVSGDISGATSGATVTGIQNRVVGNAAPTDKQVLQWNSSLAQWEPGTISSTSGASVPNYTAAFSSQTSVTVAGATHGLGTANLLIDCYDSGTPARRVEPDIVTVHPSTYDVNVIFNDPQTGRCVINGSVGSGTGGGSGAVGSVFGRTGVITAQTGDYSFSQITGTASNGQLPAPGGDLAGTLDAATVARLRGRNVAVTAPTAGQVLAWNASNSQWEPQNPASGGSTNASQLQSWNVSASAPVDGQALLWSQANNQWQPGAATGGTGGAGMAAQLGDFATARTNATTLTIGANCSIAAPCNVRFGNAVYSVTTSATVTLTGGTGVAFVYINPGGALTVGHNLTLTCAGGGCGSQSGVTAFPADSIPLWTWTATTGNWDTTGGTDRRALLSAKAVVAGTGVVAVNSGGQTTISVDTASVGLRVGVPANSTTTCTAGSWAADANYFYVCVAGNIWKRGGISSW